jgi:uncharacterized protein YbaP (TraB family)
MLALLLLWPAAVVADGAPLWVVEGDSGSVYVLGSVHLLKSSDYPLPEAVARAYEAADELLMELDLDDLDVAAVTGEMLALGASGDGPKARDVLGEDGWDRARKDGRAYGLDLEILGDAEPWLVALMVYNLALAQAGYDPALGVDQHLARRAVGDGKPIGGLESLGDQLALFDGLDPDTQRQMLEQTLDEIEGLAGEARTLVDAWRTGNLEALERAFAQDFADYPELQSRIVTDRNRSWLAAIEARLALPGTVLVVVGALHTVGPEGLPALLEARGYRVERL